MSLKHPGLPILNFWPIGWYLHASWRISLAHLQMSILSNALLWICTGISFMLAFAADMTISDTTYGQADRWDALSVDAWCTCLLFSTADTWRLATHLLWQGFKVTKVIDLNHWSHVFLPQICDTRPFEGHAWLWISSGIRAPEVRITCWYAHGCYFHKAQRKDCHDLPLSVLAVNCQQAETTLTTGSR